MVTILLAFLIVVPLSLAAAAALPVVGLLAVVIVVLLTLGAGAALPAADGLVHLLLAVLIVAPLSLAAALPVVGLLAVLIVVPLSLAAALPAVGLAYPLLETAHFQFVLLLLKLQLCQLQLGVSTFRLEALRDVLQDRIGARPGDVLLVDLGRRHQTFREVTKNYDSYTQK